MTALSETFSTALQQFRGGETREAEETCRRILEMQPRHAPALHLLGVLAHRAGRNEEAVARLLQAIALQPAEAEYHYNLGVAQQMLGRSADATASYREALRLNPNNATALNNLGQLLLNLGQLDEAQDLLLRATRLRPDYGEAQHNLALVYKKRGQFEEALAGFRQAVRIRPDDVAIHSQLAKMLEEHNRRDEAIEAYRQIVRLQPDNAYYQCSLGNLLTLRRQPALALPHYEQALRADPKDPAHHSNLGNALTQLGRPQEGEEHCRAAIHLQADAVTAHHNLGAALAAQGRLEEALESVEKALRIRSDDPGARHCRALWRLQLGRFAEGWPEYEWRWKLPDLTKRECREPLWDGSPLQGRTILLWTEQGLGDTLQFVRFIPLLKQQGATVVLECQAPLVPLLSRCPWIDRLIGRGSPVPEADVQAALLSLPRILGTTLETLPADVPYLFADPDLVERWRSELDGPPSVKIGIAWQGNPLYAGDCMRSIPLKHFAALASLPGVRLFGLQKGVGSEQRQAVAEQFYVVDLGSRLDETAGAFMDTAAVMKNLDLIVTSDTSVAHLAGALGVPVWVALSIGCDWRFFLHGEDNPWYPTMRLFRQTRFGDWGEVFARIAEELASGAASARRCVSTGGLTPRRSPVDLAQCWSRAFAQHQAGDHETAEQLCLELLEAEPCHAEALNMLGVLAHQRGHNELSRERLERAVVLRPQDPGFHYNLGVARQVLGQMQEAAASYRQTLRFQPDHPSALNNLGHALLALGQHAEAQGHLQHAVRLRPDYVEAHINLGEAYLRQDQLEEAAASLERAVQLRPDHADSHNQLGILARQQGRLDEAISHYQQAARLSPNFAAAHHNRGLALSGLGRYDEALACFDEAVRLDSGHTEARFARAMLWLLQGEFERGWRDYEYRWQYRPTPKPEGNQPLWDGSPLRGQTILLWTEQGLGDTLQFIRYAARVKQQGGTVMVQCPAKLTRLLTGCPGVDRLVPHNEPLPPYDVQAPLLSLPHILATTLESVPANVPYLSTNSELVEHWRGELSSIGGFRVGISWQGEPAYRNDRDRSIPLRHFTPLARVAGVRLISLQKGPGTEQLRETAALFPVTDLGPRLDEKGDAFVDTAAAMKCLDLVITSDTAVAHLAGALGVPVWVALTFAPEWRWLLDRQDCPWYPTMRLFRQTRRGDWEGVLARMANELRRRTAWEGRPDGLGRPSYETPLAVAVPISPGELIDKITILEIKMERIRDTAKLANVRAELAELAAAHDRWLPNSAELEQLTVELKSVNETLWQVEDDIRDCERAQDFGPRFIELARSVYRHNDRRSAVKRQINERLGSRLIEEKSYASY